MFHGHNIQEDLVIAALMDDPKLLIFDEPLSGLDVTTALVLKNLIKTLGQQGKAAFYCSHVLEVVEQACSHLLILGKGNVLVYDTATAIQSDIEHSSLEKTFMHLVEEVDADKITRDIISAMESKRLPLSPIRCDGSGPLIPKIPSFDWCASSSAVFFTAAVTLRTVNSTSAWAWYSLLALPGGFYSLFLLEKYSSLLHMDASPAQL